MTPQKRTIHKDGLKHYRLDRNLPASRTSARSFEAFVKRTARRLSLDQPKLEKLTIAVEEIPPTLTLRGKTPDQQQLPLCRLFPKTQGLPPKLVLYRAPILARFPTNSTVKTAVAEIIRRAASGK